MSLKLYYHPLSSFCMKALIALYENDTPFEREIVDLMDAASAATFKTLWPIGKFPVLRDEAKDRPNRASSSNISISIIPAARDFCLAMPTSHGKFVSAIVSTACTCTSTCRNSSPTTCGPPARTTPTASNRQRR